MNERERGPFGKPPNFLLILVDEERYPPVYESEELQAWRRQALPAHERLKEHAVQFNRHTIGSAACCPSRATLLTGQYPSLHGVSQTNGVAKEAFDSDMFWLGRNTVPTMGHYFREAGYQTYYKGKWHVTQADLVTPGTHHSVPSYHPLTGVPDPAREALYRQADPLDPYGFSSWIGPEPHGKNPRNSGSSAAIGLSGRDEVYGAEAVELLETLDRESRHNDSAKPWLVVASFVNPHDIVLYGSLTERLPVFRFAVDPMPPVPPPPTEGETLATKPRCQASYRRIYPRALQPIGNRAHYRQLYYQLQKEADRQMLRVLDALDRSSFRDDTIVLFTSDHGELLGAHGGLHQKFYCAYEEMLHVPFVIQNKRLFPERMRVDALTSHVDLLPTMLGLAGADAAAIRRRLSASFTEAYPLVGRDLSPLLMGSGEADTLPREEPVYYMSDDDVTRGQHQVSPLGWPYPSVCQPNHIETVLAAIGEGDARELWKYSRYFDNPRFWMDPGSGEVESCSAEEPAYGWPARPPDRVKTVPAPEEYELYNLTADPLETHNLAHPALATERSRSMQAYMAALLEDQRKRKRLEPSLR
ncbi:sulfatase [Paenibacillus sp. J31TS4]|uniref:sulfatase-like hydrolase/transferase n=1 Tax=Paenibacillus sp. J31TS4 TaxID=2807195 RepID=UPI001B1D0BF6|nr:sulfatase-like hydrolase/transferase [Paenibacillus sp. J31TS4]GIP38382.1 sulfatase [Paenibacillus sp. J31TS4]